MSWLILGASGFVGSAVKQATESAGLQASGLTAPRLSTNSSTPAGLAAEAAGHPSLAALTASLRDVSVVVNAAGLASPRSGDSPALRGANALLPAVLATACAAAGVGRLIHLSSAAVQGQRGVLDETSSLAPFSAYSRSKALGEQALRAVSPAGLDLVVVRATSVQGADRPTTAALARLAASPLASVAAPGTAATPVTSVESLADFVVRVGRFEGEVPPIVLQPSEGMTVRSVLEAAGGTPMVLPRSLCRLLLRAGYALSARAGERLHGNLRRVELMWFGQAQEPGWAEAQGIRIDQRVSAVLEAAASRRRQGRQRQRLGQGPGQSPQETSGAPRGD